MKQRREDKRTTVSLAKIVWEMAQEMMRLKGFNDNFSSYVADLIRRDKERLQSKPESQRIERPSSGSAKLGDSLLEEMKQRYPGRKGPPAP